MPTIHLRPIQTGDACYLQDHHNRDGECIITVTMTDSCSTVAQARAALNDLLAMGVLTGRLPRLAVLNPPMDDIANVVRWCAEQWQLAQADMPAETDRDTEGDDSERYLECHILATWEV